MIMTMKKSAPVKRIRPEVRRILLDRVEIRVHSRLRFGLRGVVRIQSRASAAEVAAWLGNAAGVAFPGLLITGRQDEPASGNG